MKTGTPKTLTVVVTTHEWPEALNICLKGLSNQSVIPNQVIVADDGSGDSTKQVVDSWSRKASFQLDHVWQEHKGFRLARIRNVALASATSDYVVFLDGDMVPHATFVEDHLATSREGCWAQGVRLLTTEERTQRMLETGETALSVFDSGLLRRSHAIRSPLLARLIAMRKSHNYNSIRGCNQGYWREDLVAVNGWNELMVGWGHEDVELAVRLYRLGTSKIEVRFAALATHLHHERRVPEGENPNKAILRHSLDNDVIRTPNGLCSHLSDPTSGLRKQPIRHR